jgi:hypothetical protein
MNPDEAYVHMEEIYSYFDNLADVVDGPDGTQLPNKEMKLMNKCQEILTWLEKLQ